MRSTNEGNAISAVRTEPVGKSYEDLHLKGCNPTEEDGRWSAWIDALPGCTAWDIPGMKHSQHARCG